MSLDSDISAGVKFLAKAQGTTGDFPGKVSRNAGFKTFKNLPSIFVTSLVLGALAELPESARARTIKRKAAKFLLTQKSAAWSFNYWKRGTSAAKAAPYPDDLDDTSVALAALRRYDEKLIDGAVLAPVVKNLTRLELKPGGPYRTWLVGHGAPEVWRDIDIAVNANAAYLLSLCGVVLPELEAFIESAVKNNKYRSPYYPSPYPVIYFIARTYAGPNKKRIMSHLARLSAHRRETALETALRTSALLLLGSPAEKLEKDIETLQKAIKKGHAPAAPFWIDNVKKGSPAYAGAAALSTAYVLEALSRFRAAQVIPSESPAKADPAEERVHAKLLTHARARFKKMPKELREALEDLLRRINAFDTNHNATLLPYRFWRSLEPKKVPESFALNLCLASLYGWMAYTAYDDLLDGSLRQAQGERLAAKIALSPANAAARELTRIYLDIFPEGSEGRELFLETMQRVDAGNAWEIKNCSLPRLPDFGDHSILAERSIGHALGPLALLLLAGCRRSSKEFKSTEIFFESYLAARQLNDDAHDWLEDLKAGRVNAAGVGVLRRWQVKHRGKKLELSSVETELRNIFWREEIKPVARAVFRHTARARKALAGAPTHNKERFEALLLKLEKATEAALMESREAADFIKEYKHR